MLKSAIISLLLLISVIINGQNLSMTFSAAGASGTVDSVKATNLRSNESVTLPGNDTLLLSFKTGITALSEINRQGFVFPNPFSGSTSLVVNIQNPQTVTLELFNLAGQAIARTRISVPQGNQSFVITLSKTGVYMLSITTNLGTGNFKLICSETSKPANSIAYAGIAPGHGQTTTLKSSTSYSLGYQTGDIILYRCRGGIHTTIIADSPTVSKSYEVEFVPCADPDGKNYAIVKIGYQTWMAENMAYLPAVSPSAKGSDSLSHYYVYDYEDSLVGPAKNTVNYHLYGVLYNWTAAMNMPGKVSKAPGGNQDICPVGWHVPYDEEWKVMETSLGMSQHDADTIYMRNSGNVGEKLKSSLKWNHEGNGSNFSGFTALAGGYRNTHGGFTLQGNYALFWTATKSDTVSWYRNLNFNDSGVYRFTTLRSQGLSVRCIKD